MSIFIYYHKRYFSAQCPASHPHVYYNGQHCCKSNKEKHYKPQGAKCDGSVIRRDSLCCQGDQHRPCPHGRCQSYRGPNKSKEESMRGGGGGNISKWEENHQWNYLPLAKISYFAFSYFCRQYTKEWKNKCAKSNSIVFQDFKEMWILWTQRLKVIKIVRLWIGLIHFSID